MSIRFLNIKGTRRWLVATTLAAACLLLVLEESRFTVAQEAMQGEAAGKASGKADLIARGKYLVEGVAACADCHTPRDKNGDLDRARWLAGAPVFLQPAQAVPGWAIVAPRIAGLPPGRDAEIITLLTTGIWSNGKPPRQPMPRFHMTPADAKAVLAYLKSL